MEAAEIEGKITIEQHGRLFPYGDKTPHPRRMPIYPCLNMPTTGNMQQMTFLEEYTVTWLEGGDDFM